MAKIKTSKNRKKAASISTRSTRPVRSRASLMGEPAADESISQETIEGSGSELGDNYDEQNGNESQIMLSEGEGELENGNEQELSGQISGYVDNEGLIDGAEDEEESESEGRDIYATADKQTIAEHQKATKELTETDKEIEKVRDKLISEKLIALNKEIESIESGEHPELSKRLEEIKEKRDKKLSVVEYRRKFLIDSINAHFQGSLSTSNAEYKAACEEIKWQLISEQMKLRAKIEMKRFPEENNSFIKSINNYSFVSDLLKPKIQLNSEELNSDLEKIKRFNKLE